MRSSSSVILLASSLSLIGLALMLCALGPWVTTHKLGGGTETLRGLTIGGWWIAVLGLALVAGAAALWMARSPAIGSVGVPVGVLLLLLLGEVRSWIVEVRRLPPRRGQRVRNLEPDHALGATPDRLTARQRGHAGDDCGWSAGDRRRSVGGTVQPHTLDPQSDTARVRPDSRHILSGTSAQDSSQRLLSHRAGVIDVMATCMDCEREMTTARGLRRRTR
jgi:hypothetical protein